MHVCYVCIGVCACMHAAPRMPRRARARHVPVCLRACVPVCLPACVPVCLCACVPVCIGAPVGVGVPVCFCACMYVCGCVFFIRYGTAPVAVQVSYRFHTCSIPMVSHRFHTCGFIPLSFAVSYLFLQPCTGFILAVSFAVSYLRFHTAHPRRRFHTG